MSCKLKEPKTFCEQIEILKERGLIIEDEERVIRFLRTNNYYRVSAYFIPHYLIVDDIITDKFLPGVRFEDVMNLYTFDSELRRILTPLLEKIEISIRTQIAYYFAHTMGALGHLEPGNFAYKQEHDKFVEMINGVTKDPKEKFLQHYKEKYEDQYPIWVIIESLSLGSLSKLYSNMTTECKKDLCREYYSNRHQKQIKKWMQGITIIRNICAHHGRLFNRDIYAADMDGMAARTLLGREKRIFSWLLVIRELTEDKKDWYHFMYELKFIIDKHNFTRFNALGFPDNWENILSGDSKELKKINTKLKIKKIYDQAAAVL